MRLVRLSESENRDEFVADFCTLPDRVRKNAYRTGMLPASVCRQILLRV